MAIQVQRSIWTTYYYFKMSLHNIGWLTEHCFHDWWLIQSSSTVTHQHCTFKMNSVDEDFSVVKYSSIMTTLLKEYELTHRVTYWLKYVTELTGGQAFCFFWKQNYILTSAFACGNLTSLPVSWRRPSERRKQKWHEKMCMFCFSKSGNLKWM